MLVRLIALMTSLVAAAVFVSTIALANPADPDFSIPNKDVNVDSVRPNLGQPISLLNEPSVQNPAAQLKTHAAVSMPVLIPVHAAVKREASTPGKYTIQLSSHTSITEAEEQVRLFKAKGIDAFQIEAVVDGVTHFRVCTGGFATFKEAKSAMAPMIQKTGEKSAFVQKRLELREPSSWIPCAGIDCSGVAPGQ
jgi:cell division septation protein DedD